MPLKAGVYATILALLSSKHVKQINILMISKHNHLQIKLYQDYLINYNILLNKNHQYQDKPFLNF